MMRGDLNPAAMRLLAALPVRTHERREYFSSPAYITEKKSFIIDGQHFASLKAAREALHVGGPTIYKWLNTGRARRG